ncbi:MAG: hypothetical protein JNL87_02200 [Burkholderiaceae bacterium]|nr:hypothetical protein [Burkholderiaceae bacterium]
MNPTLIDMRAVTAQDLATTDEASQGWLRKLLDGLRRLPEPSEAETAEALLDRAAQYAASQPSFAADLRAAVTEDAVA